MTERAKAAAEELAELQRGLPEGCMLAFDISPFDDDPETIWVEKVEANPRRRGLATELLARVFMVADRYGLKSFVFADPSGLPGEPDLHDLVSFYRRFGAEPYAQDHGWEFEGIGMLRPAMDPAPSLRHMLARYGAARGDVMPREELEGMMLPQVPRRGM